MGRRRKKKRIERKITVGYDVNGVRVRRSFYGFSNDEIDEKIREYNIHSDLPPETALTLSEYAEWWAEHYKQGTVSDLTYYNTYQISIQHIQNYFGDQLMRNVSQADIQTFFVKNARRNKWQIDKFYYILKNVFGVAVFNGMIQKNPFYNITKSYKESKEKGFYKMNEYLDIVAFAMDDPDGLGPYIALNTGLRRGELCGLQWGDIDFDSSVLSVKRAVTYGVGHRVVTNDGKSKSAIREIPLSGPVCRFLFSKAGKQNEYVLNGETTPPDPNNYANRAYKRFKSRMADAGLRPLNLHELRHSYGTMLYKSGTPLEVIAKVMGHSDVGVTEKIYIHDDVEDSRNRMRSVFEATDNEGSKNQKEMIE